MPWKDSLRYVIPAIISLIKYIWDSKNKCKQQEQIDKIKEVEAEKEQQKELDYMEKHLKEKLDKMVVVELKREYHKGGVNGEMTTEDGKKFFTIELPWLNNQPRISCIPEGEYKLTKRTSERFGWHVKVNHVLGRSNILFHAANNATEELAGCIAPVTKHTGPGAGSQSRKANDSFRNWVYNQIDSGKDVILKIS